MATIVEVAAHAGVSTATVSRVLSAPSVVKIETRERVLRSIEALSYEPNLAARALRTDRSAKILVIVPDVSNPFFSLVIRGISDVANRAGYSLVLGDAANDPRREDQYAAMLHQREVDGLIILGSRLPDNLGKLMTPDGMRAPIVNACEYDGDALLPSIRIDNHAAGADAIEHLAGLGHRSIGIITGPLNSPLNRDRLQGAQAVASAQDIELVVDEGDFSIEHGYAAARSLIGLPGLSALFCFSDELAVGAMRSAMDHRLCCPSDVSIVGFDDIGVARYLNPALTTVAQPSRTIGQRAAETLLSIIAKQTVEQVVVLAHELVVRASTGPARPAV